MFSEVDSYSNLELEISEIIKNKPAIKLLFKATPYDRRFDLGGKLSEELYLDRLHVSNEILMRALNSFKTKLKNAYQTPNIIMLSGYAGNGKTTFIRSFKRKFIDDYNCIYLDVYDKYISHGKSISKAEKSVLAIIQNFTILDEQLFIKTLDFILKI